MPAGGSSGKGAPGGGQQQQPASALPAHMRGEGAAEDGEVGRRGGSRPTTPARGGWRLLLGE